MSSTLRLRRKPLLEVVQRLDAFDKVPETVREEKGLIGGTIFLICAILIAWLVISEFIYYTSTRYDYRFTVDTEFDTKLQIDIDIVVSMPCDAIGADVMDATDRPLIFTENQLRMDPVDFELSEKKRQYWNLVRELKKNQKPAQPGLQNMLFISSDFLYGDEEEVEPTAAPSDDQTESDEDGGGNVLIIELGANGWRQRIPSNQKGRHGKNACRIHGFVKVNKVDGNLHITPGKSLPVVGGGHLHISAFGGPSYNFSHRVQRLSFGPYVAGLMNPLDGVEEISNDPFQLYQYYAQVVPTKVRNLSWSTVDTCQYAISKRHRTIDHSRGSHGMPGIFIKYEINPIKVDVYETRRSYVEFFVRLCAIIGGIFATSGVIHLLIGGLFHVLLCRCIRTKNSSVVSVPAKEALTNGVDGDATVQHLSVSSEFRTPEREYGQPFVT